MFLGIIVDTEASRKSIASYSQFQALQQSNPARERSEERRVGKECQ